MIRTDGTAVAATTELDGHRWKDRPLASWAIRCVAFVLPLVGAAVVTRAFLAVVDRPQLVLGQLLFWAGAFAVAIVTAIGFERWTRRLLPLASLLRLSLAFPGEAPNRALVSLRELSAKRLEHQLVEGAASPESSSAQNLISLVGLLRRHDHVTRGHSERVCGYAELIGQELQLEPDEIDRLKWAALIHDIGKLAVPPRILNNPHVLDDEDRLLIRNHPVAATAYLGVVSAWLGEWALAALEHHERWDGDGYPSGLRGDSISLAGRIVAVADAYDVLTAANSYQASRSINQALEELARCAGTQFDPAVVHALLQIPRARLRRQLGPVGWLSELDWFPRVPETTRLVAGTAAASLAVAAGTAFTVDTGPDQGDEVAAVERTVEDQPTTTTIAAAEVLGEAADAAPTTSAPATTTPPAPAIPTRPPTLGPLPPPTTTTTTTTPPLAPLTAPSGPTGSGFVIVAPSSLPRTLADGELTSDDHAFVWFETPVVTTSEIALHPAADGFLVAGAETTRTVLAPETSVCTVFVHTDPRSGDDPILVELDFGVVPLGFALRGEDLDATASFGVERVDHRSDGLSIDDIGTLEGTVIRFNMTHSVAGRDQLRIFLAC